MRWNRRFWFFLLVGFSLASAVQAAELAPEGTRTRKLQRGLLNTFFAPVELSQALEPEKTKDTWVPSWFQGLFVGSVNMVGRAVTGIYEIVTFPIPSPPDYKPVYHPEFSLEHLGVLKQDVSSPKDEA